MLLQKINLKEGNFFVAHPVYKIRIPHLLRLNFTSKNKGLAMQLFHLLFLEYFQRHTSIIFLLQVTEFAALGSLLDRLRCRDITSIATLSQFSVQISSGMVFLHSKNLVHRDLSARNILVTAENQVRDISIQSIDFDLISNFQFLIVTIQVREEIDSI